MIEVTRLGNQPVIVNAELIEFIEQTPDTLISTTSGKKILVQESVQEIVERVIAYRRRCLPTVAPPKSGRVSKQA